MSLEKQQVESAAVGTAQFLVSVELETFEVKIEVFGPSSRPEKARRPLVQVSVQLQPLVLHLRVRE